MIVNNVVLNNTKVQTKGYATTASLVIDSATISTTAIIGVYPNSETIEVKNSNLNNCTINSDSYNYGITIRNSFVAGSTFTIGCCGGNISIISSTLSSSTIYNGGGNPVTGPLKIIMSNLVNTPVNLPSAKVEITSSVINYNTSNGLIFGNGFIQCSQILGSGSGTAVKITGYNGYNIGGNVLIKNSTINQNSIGIEISNANTMTIDSSNFDYNSSYHVKNLSTKNIIAKNNWWGTTDLTTIANKIYDYYDNINYGIVNFSNLLYSIYNSQNCPDSLTFPTAIPENINNTISSIFDFKIYPNPSSNYVNLEFENSNKEYEDVIVEIVNPMGQILYVGNLKKSTHTQIIDVSSYNKGIYFCKLQSGKDFEIKKLLVQ
ncbi:MAG: T9SS type A sorting domain-containing protein [Bacteroidia bacterium]|nr:T9SS type A sorting domain-containing protein [Bacteroidia bacterium]